MDLKQAQPIDGSDAKPWPKWLAPLVILGVTLTLYAPTFYYDYIEYDDALLIVQNQKFFADLANIPQLFRQGSWRVAGHVSPETYYRPLYILSFMLDAQIAGASAGLFHFNTVLIHALACLAFFFFLRSVGTAAPLALVVALFVAVHPTLVSVPAWITGRSESLFSICVFLSLFSLSRFATPASPPPRRRWIALGVHLASVLAALFLKESGIVLPAVLALYFVLILKEKVVSKKSVLLVFGWTLAIVFFSYCRSAAIDTHRPGMALSVLANNALDNSVFFLHYVGKAFVPAFLSVAPTREDTPTIIGVAVLIALCLLLALSRKRRLNVVLFGLGWFLVFLAPGFVVRDLAGVEHRLYVPFFGLLIAVLEIDALRDFRWTQTKAIAATLGLILFSALSYQRMGAYQNRESYWTSAAQTSPHSALAHFNVGVTRASKGDLQRAEQAILTAHRLDPNLPMLNNNLGILHARKGKLDQAEPFLRREIVINPTYADAYFNLGLVHKDKGQLEKAKVLWQRALQLNPGHAGANRFLRQFSRQ